MSSEATIVSASGAPVAGQHPSAADRVLRVGARLRRRGAGGALAKTATVEAVALGAMLCAGLLIAALAASRTTYLSPPSRVEFPFWLAGPLTELLSWYTPSRAAIDGEFTAALGVMFAAYALVVARADRLTARLAIGIVVALHVVFFLAPPLPLTDVFNYLNYGRMDIVHGLNPYATPPVLGPHGDPSYLVSNWHHLLSPYGPLFTLFTLALVPLGLPLSFWALKLCLLLVSLAVLWLVWRCAELLGREPLPATLLVGLNPVVLVWGLGGDHNDALMMLMIVGAVYLLITAQDGDRPGAEIGAGVALVAAVAIKASAAILLPVVLLGYPRKPRLLLGIAAAGALVAAATLLAFGSNLPNLGDQSRLVTLYTLPNLLGLALGSGGQTDLLRSLLGGVLGVSVLATAAWAWRTGRWLVGAAVASLLLLLTLSWTLPWYVVWLLPLAALAGERWLRRAALALTLYLLLVWLPLTGSFMNTIGFHPESTMLARQHQAETKLLLH